MKTLLAILALSVCAYAGTYTAASCSQANVNGCVNGTGVGCASHTPTDGDIINVPSGSCTYTTSTGITVPSNIGVTIIGSGTPNSGSSTTGASASCASGTTITLSPASGTLKAFSFTPQYGNSTTRISCMTLAVGSPSSSFQVIGVNALGTCTSSGCPNLRMDNITFSNWPGHNTSAGISFGINAVGDMFGVVDHNTVNGSAGNFLQLIEESNGSYLGVGSYGDNSWHQSEGYGGANFLFIEYNQLNTAGAVEDEGSAGASTNQGGNRVVVRNNTYAAMDNLNQPIGWHGTESNSRPRGGRVFEFYNNSITITSGQPNIGVIRSGTGLAWNNTVTNSGGSMSNFFTPQTYRAGGKVGGWPACDGSGAYDQNDGTTYYSGTINSYNSGTGVVTVNGSPGWTTNQWSPAGSPYSMHDVTQTNGWEISANTANTLTLTQSLVGGPQTWTPAASDSIQILRSTWCLDQGFGRGAGILYSGSPASPSSVANEVASPAYLWQNTTPTPIFNLVASNSLHSVANRDWYTETLNQGAQTTSSTPFNGSSGAGHGTALRRPSTCTAGVWYWETDNLQGDLCTPSGWTTGYYVPYTNPHPLDGGPATYTITVSSIIGGGTITSSDSVINCTTGTTGTCTDSSASGTITLTASAATNYKFLSWGGTCTGGNSTCSVSSVATVTATFIAASVTQFQLSGPFRIIGGFSTVPSISAPLLYPLSKVDNCETGAESQCTAQGGTGAPLANLGRYASLGFGPPGTNPIDTAPAIGPSGTAHCTGSATTQPQNGQYLCSSLAVAPYTLSFTVTDPDFNTPILRATDSSFTQTCTSCSNNAYNVGSGGDNGRWSSGSDKLLINTTSGASIVLSINEAAQTSTLSALNGGVLGSGAFAFANTNDNVLYEMNAPTSESTVLGSVTSGACVTPETMTQAITNAHATMSAINPTVLMQFQTNPTVGGHTPNSSNIWTGGTSGCQFTPTAAPTTFTNAATLYQGVINTAGNPSTWTILWSLVFNFNFVSGLGAPYFPTGSGTCIPASYVANWTGTPRMSDDDTLFTIALSTNGQATTGSSTTGPIYEVSYTSGKGCSAWNTFTDVVTGDWGLTGSSMVNGQNNKIPGTITGTFATPTLFGPGETLTQSVTGATTMLTCTQNASGVCATSSLTGVQVGNIFGTADASHTWTGGTSGATLAPSGAPTPTPWVFPALIHDALTQHNSSAGANVTLVQSVNGKISGSPAVVNTAGVTHTTVISMSNTPTYNVGQQIQIYNLVGAHDTYLNCTTANNCPIWTITATGSGTITVSDTVGTGYSDNETQTGCTNGGPTFCPTLAPNGPPNTANGAFSYFNEPWYWVPGTLTINPCLSVNCQGHAAAGFVNEYRAKKYWAFSPLNPNGPCTVNGPQTPCPSGDTVPLSTISIPVDQHGSYTNANHSDAQPVGFVTTNVCGLSIASGACTSYGSSLWNEVDMIQNTVTQSASCNYSTANPQPIGGPFINGCIWRATSTYNTGSNWNFAIQNAIGSISHDGRMFAFPTDFGATTGCMNQTTNCWSGYTANAPANTTITSISASACGTAPCSITVTSSNNFCTPGSFVGTAQSGGQGMPCGSQPLTVTMPSGLTGNNTWLNGQTLTVTSVAGCNASQVCTSFTGTVPLANPNGTYTLAATGTVITPACILSTPCQRGDIAIAFLH